MKAWLITWAWTGEHAKVDDPVISVRDSRFSSRTIGNVVEQAYADLTYTPAEKLTYLQNKRNIPYRAKISHGDIIICGANPWIEARIVQNVRLEISDNGNQKLLWDEIDRTVIWEKLKNLDLKPCP